MSSLLQRKRFFYQPLVPVWLRDLSAVCLRQIPAASFPLALEQAFSHSVKKPRYSFERGRGKSNRPLKMGVFFSGGQASGGHNVIAGLFDGLKEVNPESVLLGFLDGPNGLIENRFKILDFSLIDGVRNQGGFDLIGSSRTKIETEEQIQKAALTVQKHHLDAIMVIGGDDSNTNAAMLAESFLQQGISTCVMGVPKTIDGDLRSFDIELSFGFDSATKTYSELIGNIARDALSAKKYYHFIKLMGRSASHIVLECALATCPNLALIGEEKRSLDELVQDVADLIAERKQAGKEFGVILIPEGLIEFVPEMKGLIAELNRQLASSKDPQQAVDALTGSQKQLMNRLPEKIRQQLLLERDPHGNVQVSQIETEYLILDLVHQKLKKQGLKMNALQHFFGYEGRSCLPTNFDANYGYALGRFGALAARDEATGVILALKHLHLPAEQWEPRVVKLIDLLHFEERSGKKKPVIAKTLVDLSGKIYQKFAQKRAAWRLGDCYQNPGPIQFFGDFDLTDTPPLTLLL